MYLSAKRGQGADFPEPIFTGKIGRFYCLTDITVGLPHSTF
jgi:hypothetical protein